MSIVKKLQVAATVTATGGASQAFFTNPIVGGQIESIRYRRGAVLTSAATTSGIATGAHVTITGAITGVTIITATATGDVTWYPRAAAMDVSGGAIGYSSAATPPPIPVPISIAEERLKIEVTSGGAASNGGLHSIFEIYYTGM